MKNYALIVVAAFALNLNASEVRNEIHSNESQLDLMDIANATLNDVLSYNLITGNSVASTTYDQMMIEINRLNLPITSNVLDIDLTYNFAAAILSGGVAYCWEYAVITLFSLLNNYSDRGREIVINIYYGTNFDHVFLTISKPSDSLEDYIVIDPWMRKVFPLAEMPFHLHMAGIEITHGTEHAFRAVKIVGNYNHNIHKLENLSSSRKGKIAGPKVMVRNKPPATLLMTAVFDLNRVLMMAVLDKNYEVIKFLLDNMNDDELEAQDPYGRTIMHLVANLGDDYIAYLILSRHPQLAQINKNIRCDLDQPSKTLEDFLYPRFSRLFSREQ